MIPMVVRDLPVGTMDGRFPGEEEMVELATRVRRAVRRSCPRFLAEQADDIAQEVLLRLLKKFKTDEGNPTFSSMYLSKAAHGVTVDEIRRRVRRREQTGMDEMMLEERNTVPDPEETTAGRVLGQEIRRCLECIAPARRVAVTLHLLGCSVPEVARRLGCPEKSADNRVYRGMKNLRDCLAAKGLRP